MNRNTVHKRRGDSANPADKSIFFIVAVFFLVLGSSVFLFFSLKSNIISDMIENEDLIKVLFIIVDDAKDPKDGKNVRKPISSNVFFYYPKFKRCALVNIPENTGSIYAALGRRTDRILSVYTEKGVEAYRQEIEKLINQDIHVTVQITLNNFCKLTDLFGGLKAFIPHDVDVKQDDGSLFLLPSGAITLDGDKMRTYMTYASIDSIAVDSSTGTVSTNTTGSANEDTEESIYVRRQSALLSLFGALSDNAQLLQNRSAYRVIRRCFNVGLPKNDFRDLLMEIAALNTDRTILQTVTGELVEVDGANILFPYYDGQLIKDTVRQMLSSLTSLDEIQYSRVFVIEIQNGTPTQGLARNTAILLRNVGYDVLNTVNADSSEYEQTFIVNHIGDEEIAKKLGDFLRCTNIVTEENRPKTQTSADSAAAGPAAATPASEDNYSVAGVDFTIVLGKDFDGRYVRATN
ncbi:MAG: LCP family protein [Treponemataceae bacterium]|nr:MAG: LCP family protein [Treponemataceae bacterium]